MELVRFIVLCVKFVFQNHRIIESLPKLYSTWGYTDISAVPFS